MLNPIQLTCVAFAYVRWASFVAGAVVVVSNLYVASVGHAQWGERLVDIAKSKGKDFGFVAPWRGVNGSDPEFIEESIVEAQANVATINLGPECWLRDNITGAVTYDFSTQRPQKEYLKSKGIRIVLHCLVGPQISPNWLMTTPFSATQLDALMQNWIQAVANEFGADTYAAVIVNEAVTSNGNDAVWNTEKANAKWLSMGYQDGYPKYVVQAYKHAATSFPANVKFIYNDNGFETMVPGTRSGNRANRIYALCNYLKNQPGVRIDLIGFQSHFDIGYDRNLYNLATNTQTPEITSDRIDIQSFSDNITRFGSALGLPAYITELDIGVPTDGDSQMAYYQAKWYGYVLDMAMKNPHCQTVIIWGSLDEKDLNWQSIYQHKACLFTRQGVPKTAYYGAQLGMMGVCLEKTYRISDGWTNNFIHVGAVVQDTPVVTHSSNPSWTYSKWKVKLASNGPVVGGTIRLENVGAPNMFLEATSLSNNPIRLRMDNDIAAQRWAIQRSPAGSNRIVLISQSSSRRANATGIANNSALITWPANGLDNQSFRLLPQ